MLTEKQIQEFIKFYRDLYGDTSEATGTGKLPEISKAEEEHHIRLWKDFLTSLIGVRKSKRPYTHKGGRTETTIDAVFNKLWFWYWPVVR